MVNYVNLFSVVPQNYHRECKTLST